METSSKCVKRGELKKIKIQYGVNKHFSLTLLLLTTFQLHPPVTHCVAPVPELPAGVWGRATPGPGLSLSEQVHRKMSWFLEVLVLVWLPEGQSCPVPQLHPPCWPMAREAAPGSQTSWVPMLLLPPQGHSPGAGVGSGTGMLHSQITHHQR